MWILLSFLVLLALSRAQEILNVAVSVDEGQERLMRLHVGQSPLEAAKLFVMNELRMQPLDATTQEPTDVTISLANILLTRLNEKNAEDFRLQQESEKQASNPVVFSFPVSINGNDVNMEIRSKSSASDSASMFCGSLRIDGNSLGREDLAQCVDSATSLAIQRITEYNNNQKILTQQTKQSKSEIPIFEVPIKIGEEVLPLSISVSENPATSTSNFCSAQWGKISGILAAGHTGEQINAQLCHQVLLSTVVGMFDQMLASPEGKAAVAEVRVEKEEREERSNGFKKVAVVLGD